MKKLWMTLLLALGLFTLPERKASAQLVGTMDFTTSFPFYVGNALLPAGSYHFRNENTDASMLLLESDTLGKVGIFIEYIPMKSASPHRQSDVVFHKYGDREYLSNLWLEGQRFGMKIEPSKGEKRYIQNKTPIEHSVSGKKHGS